MVKQYQKHIAALLNQANQVLLGKETRIKLALSTLFANGHLLINDIPGVGKTTLANLVARLFGLDFQRSLPVTCFQPISPEYQFSIAKRVNSSFIRVRYSGNSSLLMKSTGLRQNPRAHY